MGQALCIRNHRRLGAAVLVCVLSLAWPGGSAADVTGFRPAGFCQGSTGTDAGTAVWSGASNAAGTGATMATAGLGGASPLRSEYLKCNNYGFTVPPGSTIDAIDLQTRRERTGNTVADAHVFPVRSDDVTIGSVGSGSDRRRVCPLNDWGAVGDDLYTDAVDPRWGIAWGACAAGDQRCPPPNGPFNVNHANFGAALAAEVCSATPNGTARVDNMRLQVTYTIPSCATAPWAPITVAPLDNTPGATTLYAIGTRVPNVGGCALTGATDITIALTGGTDGSAVTTGTIDSVPFTTTIHTATQVGFRVPAGALQPCGTQSCLGADTPITIQLNNVRNPPTDGDPTLSMTATPTLNGQTGTTSSNPYIIAAPCVPSGAGASQWGPITATLTDPAQSVPAQSGGLPACARFTRYTIGTTVPSPGGCRLVSGTEIVVTFPSTPAGTDASMISAATVNGTTVTPEPSADARVVRLRPTMDINNGQPLTITLDTVQNPFAAATPATLTLHATNTRDGNTGTSSGTYNVTATTACAPTLDFYVRDWTSATAHDMGDPIPPATAGPDWATSSDVWTQYTDVAPTVAANDWVRGVDVAKSETNYAFARVSLKTTGAPLTPRRDVRARFYIAPFGASPTFGPLAEVTQSLSSTTPLTFVHVQYPSATVAGITAGTKLCLAVEIDSQSDPLTSATINGTNPDAASKNRIEADPNQAQRNLAVIAVPAEPPPPAGGGGGMMHFAMAHNGTMETRDVAFRIAVPRDALEHLRDAKVAVVGGEAVPLRPGGTISLPGMRPGEDRWISLEYSLAGGREGAMIPVEFDQMHGEERVSGFTFGIVPTAMPDVVRENLRLHHDVFSRLSTAFGIREGKAESAAALKLYRAPQVSEPEYVSFLQEHRRPIGAAVAALQKQSREKDLVGLAAGQKVLWHAVEEGEIHDAATAHLALLEKLDVVQNMREIAKGNPFDILPTVRWQRELFATVPRLKALDVSAEVVKQSETFIDGYGSGKSDAGRYAALLASLQKPFQATAAALRKEGIDAGAALADLQGQRKASPGAQQKAHRAFLLVLHEGLGRDTPAQTAN